MHDFSKPHARLVRILNIHYQITSISNMATTISRAKATLFFGKDQDGNTVSLKDFRQKALLYFYPEDDICPPAPCVCGLQPAKGQL